MARRRALARVSGRSQQFPAGDALALAGALDEAAIVTLASAATVAIGAAQANTIQISGATTITSFDTVASGAVRRLVFSGALTLTHNATKLILPGAANITTAAGDAATFVSLGGGNWRCVAYQLAASLGSGGGAALTKYFESGQQAFTPRGTITIAHGLADKPKLVSCFAICISSEGNYAVGDMIELGASNQAVRFSSSEQYIYGQTISFDAVNLYVQFGVNPFIYGNKGVGSYFISSAANWRLVFRAAS